MENTVAKVIKVFAVIYLILLLIGGIALGNTYQMQSPEFTYTVYLVFNWPLTIGVWISGSIIGLVLFGLAEAISILQEIKNDISIIHNQENIIGTSDSKLPPL